jgi:hypothetical protein
MEEMEWFSSVMSGVSAAKSLALGWIWLEPAKLLANEGHQNSVTSLIGHTWRK